MSTTPPAPFNLSLLGTFRLECGGERIALYSRKVEALLAYLCLSPQEHARERLAGLFWGDTTTEQARLSLRVGLNNLRKQLGNDAILATRNTLQLNPAFSIWVDVWEFMALKEWLPENGLENLLFFTSLYRSELLADFYDEWLFPLREELRALYLNALLRGASYARAQSDYPSAIELAQKVLTTDPVNEQAHQHLIVCHAARGDRTAAFRQYEECAQALRTHLGVDPSRETRTLYENLRKKSPAISPAARLTNLPRPLTSFVGRQTEMNFIENLLLGDESAGEDATRAALVTLGGPGGSGKTRLAIQTASELVDAYADGVWWVDLSPLNHWGLLPSAVAKTLGVKERRGKSLTESLKEHLRARNLLLIMDNCEHILTPSASLIEGLLAECRQLQVLATSRTPLGIPGERYCPVAALPLPHSAQAQVTNLKALLACESVKLFVDRAAAYLPTFQLTPQNAALVAHICQRLEGIPLALELAAAQIPAMPLAEIVRRLDERLDLAPPASHGTPRQRTLRTTLTWSHDLLEPAEKALFCRLAVFAGGWTLEQATRIAGGFAEGEAQLYPHETREDAFLLPINGKMVVRTLLANLAGKSLLQMRYQEGETRYSMLETVRAFAQEKLEEAGQWAETRARHTQYFHQRALSLWPQFLSPTESDALQQIEADFANFQTMFEAGIQDPEMPWHDKAISSLSRFCHIRGMYQQGRDWVERLLAHPRMAESSYLRGNTYNEGGLLHWHQGDYDTARQYFLQSLADFEQAEYKRGMAVTLNNLGNLCYEQNDTASAQLYYEKALPIATEIQDKKALGMILNNLGLLVDISKDPAPAQALLEQSLAIRQELGDQRGMAITLNNLGDIFFEAGDYVTAHRYLLESLRLALNLGDQRAIVMACFNVINLYMMTDTWEVVAQLLGLVDEIVEKWGGHLPKAGTALRNEAEEKAQTNLLEAAYLNAYETGRRDKPSTLLSLAEKWQPAPNK